MLYQWQWLSFSGDKLVSSGLHALISISSRGSYCFIPTQHKGVRYPYSSPTSTWTAAWQYFSRSNCSAHKHLLNTYSVSGTCVGLWGHQKETRCMPAWRSDCWEKSAETYADTEFLEDWSCHFLRTLEGQTEGRQGTEVSGKISLRRCQPNSAPGWASQGSRPLIVALYNWCFIYNWRFISLVHLMYHHISEHKIKIDWIDSATFYWDTVLRAFTRIMSFS